MKYEAIIFDMDGTITDTERLWDKATQRFLQEQGVRMTPAEKSIIDAHFQGLSLADATLYMKDMFNLTSSLEDLMEKYSQHACALYEEEVCYIDGFLAFHATLDAHNLKYGIATNADDSALAATKRALDLQKLFGEHIYNITHVHQQGKPKPDIYLYAARELRIDPKACIAIEDSAHGVAAAKAANMLCIGINSHGNPEQLIEADIIIDGYHEIDLLKLLYPDGSHGDLLELAI